MSRRLRSSLAREARYEIERESAEQLVIRDVGPWHRHPTVTNDAEGVVARLHADGHLPPGRQLLYIDSLGGLDELSHDGCGAFIGFKPGPSE